MDVLLDVLCGASMNLYDNSLVAYGNLRGPPPNNANIPQEIAGLIRGIPLNKAGLIFLGVNLRGIVGRPRVDAIVAN